MKPSISQTPGNDCTPSHQIISCVIPIFPPPPTTTTTSPLFLSHFGKADLAVLLKRSALWGQQCVWMGGCCHGGHCVHSHLHNDALQRLAVIAVLGSGQEGFSRGFGVGRRKEGG